MATKRLIQRYFSFSGQERKDFLLTSIILSFVLFFFAWRNTSYNVLSGIIAFIAFFVIVLLSLFIFIAASKWFAIHRHYTASYSAWITASLIGFVVSFTTFGFLPLMFPGLIEVTRIDRLRHGKIFAGENKYDIFTILAIAPLTSIIISLFMQFLYQVTNLEFFYYFMIFNAALAFFSLLPFTKNIGSHLFYVQKKNYFFLLFFSSCFFILILFNLYFSFIFALLLAAILFLLLRKPLKSFDI